ncbi:hypothetical protein V5N11_011987 [Cardamine amara subsp. amara]|uniref:CCHC-type domain-containing protein n=1 Tax=Cardamine amara subsp. amara TaxID=228776 RepID=A0ABD1AF11_CARAN
MAAANVKEDAVTDDLNYEIWARIAKTTLVEKGLWDVVENGVPPDPSKIPELGATIQVEDLSKWRDLVSKDMKALQILQSSLTDSAFRKTLSASSAKDVWDLLEKGNNEQAKLRRLEKQFEELKMDDAEPIVLYLDRVVEIAEQLRRLKNRKSDYQVIKKVLSSLSESHEGLDSVLEEVMDLKNMTLKNLAAFFNRYESLRRRGECFQCGEKGHFGKNCNRSNQSRSELPQYEMLSVDIAPVTFDEDMWMIYTTTSNHMTPYLKFFTSLDRTHRARVVLANGSIIMAEGRGDVKIMTKEGKKTIKNVLYVPKIDRNVLSFGQMAEIDYTMTIEGGKCILQHKRTGKVFGETMWEERGFALRFQVIEGNLTS